jgi:hypothetical protein
MRARKRTRLVVLAAAAAVAAFVPALARGDGGILELVPDTDVLLAKVANTGGGGNGGNTSSASSATNIFAPASYVDYHTLGGEPTTIVDRYPFVPGPNGFGATSQQYRDLVYVSNPLGVGFPGYSEFYKSSDGGQTFRVPPHNPYFTNEPVGTEGSGGGDSHQAVGQTTHSVFFIDLSGACVTMNISRDLGEHWSSNKLGCEANPGAIDDRQWVATDETDGLQNVYMNFNNDTGCIATSEPGCSIVFVKSTNDGGANTPADFSASPCNAFSQTALPGATSDEQQTVCPDPTDPNLWIAGPVAVDTSSTSPYWHTLYIPFERQVGGNFVLYLATSTDKGQTWTRRPVANVGPHDAANIFPQLTIDTAGNLYYTWSQTVGDPNAANGGGETDVYYAYSTTGGATWSQPIDLTPEANDSAVFPWMVAGSPGQVDLVLYKANSGLNPNIAFYDVNGNPCTEGDPGCNPNTTVWNTYFGQSQNALNTGSNFKLVQISDHPIHTGGVCTGGLSCDSSPQANRDLLDFLTIDVDHTGAAYTTWADDNNSRHDTRQFFSRQLSGASIFKGQNIAAMNAYPITDHSVTDPGGDTTDPIGEPKACPSMDVLGTSADRSGDQLTVSLTLAAPPTMTAAITCAIPAVATGGLWGAEFWAASNPVGNTAIYNNDNFYVAYRDNPLDGAPHVEGGAVNSISPSFTHDEFNMYEGGTLGGNCTGPLAPSPCTLTMTVSLTGLGVKPGSILSSVTGLSTYYFGSGSQPPGFRIPLGNSNLADAATPFDVNGTGTTGK